MASSSSSSLSLDAASGIEDQEDEDLIDFDFDEESTIVLKEKDQLEVASGEDYTCTTETLLDSELPILEKKLQSATAVVVDVAHKTSVDVEDILIAIDEDVIDGNLKQQQKEQHQDLLDFSLFKTPVVPAEDDDSSAVTMTNTEILMEIYANERSSFDYDEALIVLAKLDEILNETLRQCDQFLNGTESEEESLQDCLNDLDNYLNEQEATQNHLSTHLLQLVGKEDGEAGREADLKHFRRNSSGRVTIGSCVGFGERRRLARGSRGRKSMMVGKERSSGPGVVDLEDIDWGSVRRVAHDVMVERRAHASGRCCTGAVLVEPCRNLDSSSNTVHAIETTTSAPTATAILLTTTPSVPINETVEEVAPDEVSSRPTSTWLRSSMRRLRHLRLPSDGPDTNTAGPEPPPPPPPPSTTTSALQMSGRPVSAPARIPVPSRPRRPASLSSSGTSAPSSVDSSPAPTPTPSPGTRTENGSANTNRSCERQRSAEIPEMESPLGQWPHGLSSMLACLSCTLGLFNICRFAILSIHFGANFIFQFFVLSLLIGLPLFTLQSALGQQLGAGVIDMWRISPLFQGVGVSLLLSQAMVGLYSIVGISWIFVYFRDSFITKMDKYRWAEPFFYYRNGVKISENGTYKLSETIPDYLSGVVLQRHHLTSGHTSGTIKFQLAFNLAVVWMIVFVSLSKGLRSYGKVIYVFTLLPIFGTFILCAKLLGMMPHEFINVIFPETNWSEFFLNTKSWLAAAQEVFLTWGLLAAAVMQLTSHNKYKHVLQRDSSLITVITFTILLLVAFLANTCVQILKSYGYTYLPDSFEKINTYVFLRPTKEPLPPSLASVPVRYMLHNSFIVGDRVTRPGIDGSNESGYQVLRFATELVPATFALLGSENISPFWAVLFYFILILFGIAQQLAIWHCLITGIMAIKAKVLKSWETTITFFSCACGFVLGLPMTTEFGINLVYFMDFTVGGSWWLILIIVLQIIAVFMVRGRPYSGDTVVTALFTSPSQSCTSIWAPALLSFTWNVVLPVTLMILCITVFKNGNYRELFVWHHAPSVDYWPLWARQVGSMLQLLPILFVPLIAVLQSYRYLNNGPPDILDRIQLLYRPPIGRQMEDFQARETAEASSAAQPTSAQTANLPSEDPPPKYTPPPSYTTATGARIAKMLRQSIRRSVRRLAHVLGESSNTNRQRRTTQNQNQNETPEHQHQQQPPPPDYNAVLVEMNQNQQHQQTVVTVVDSVEPESNLSCAMTAADVASILRNSFRRSARRAVNTLRRTVVVDSSMSSLSAENLVASAAPIGETSLVLDAIGNLEDKAEDGLQSVIR